jgi:hypothetical protein
MDLLQKTLDRRIKNGKSEVRVEAVSIGILRLFEQFLTTVLRLKSFLAVNINKINYRRMLLNFFVYKTFSSEN